jgi:hypothetical protein
MWSYTPMVLPNTHEKNVIKQRDDPNACVDDVILTNQIELIIAVSANDAL